MESRDLESGWRSGRINQRGVWTKLLADGGRPECELAKRYRADAKALAARWQRTASVLNLLADVYEGFGRHDDITAEAPSSKSFTVRSWCARFASFFFV